MKGCCFCYFLLVFLMILIGGVSRCSCRSNEEWYPKPAPQQSNSNYKSLSRQEKEFKEPKGDKIEYHDEICLYCNGSGRIICSNCNGTGYYNEKCSSCNGRGKILLNVLIWSQI